MIIRIIEKKEVKKALIKAPKHIRKLYQIWYRLIEEHGIRILRSFPGYKIEKLSGEWVGFVSIRLNKEWRVIFSSDANNKIEIITIIRLTPHDYRKN